MKRTVIIDATEAFNPERRGIGMQMRAWLQAAPFADFPNVEFVLAHHDTGKADELLLDGANARIWHIHANTATAYVDQLYAYKPQLIFFPLTSPQYIRKGPVKTVGVNYGMEDLYARDYIAPYDIADLLHDHRQALQDFSGVVTVSETSKRDLAWFFPEYKDKLTVIYPGIVTPYDNDKSASLPNELKESRYFMIMGYEHKKNIKRISQAFNDFKQQTKSSTKLVIVGKPGYGASEIDTYISSLPCRDDILRLGYISEAEKSILLQHCHAVVALPIYEGFGISALEGLAAGNIVLVSDNGSLREVIGQAGYLADPFSITSMIKQFMHIDTLGKNPKHRYIAQRLAVFDQGIQSRKLLHYLAALA